MRLTLEEFSKIRELLWINKEFDGKFVYTLSDLTSTRLFWIDFVRHVFAPKFAGQDGVSKIENFDITSPVYIDESMDLKLPSILESAMYFYFDGETLDRATIDKKMNDYVNSLDLKNLSYDQVESLKSQYYTRLIAEQNTTNDKGILDKRFTISLSPSISLYVWFIFLLFVAMTTIVTRYTKFGKDNGILYARAI